MFPYQANRLVHSADVLQDKIEQVGKYGGERLKALRCTKVWEFPTVVYTMVYNTQYLYP